MKRLIYAPKVWVYINARNNLYDVSDYVVSGDVERRINEVSSATVVLRNPNRVFTKLGNPAFLPMDPITIFMQRHIDTPVRVFTGWIDESPYHQIKPGICTIKASCTLKKLQFTFWDPALPFVLSLLTKLGWLVDTSNGVLSNPQAFGGGPLLSGGISDSTTPTTPGAKPPKTPTKTQLQDGSMGQLLFTILTLVGGWAEQNVYIENLPANLTDWIARLYTKITDEDGLTAGGESPMALQVSKLLGAIIGTGTLTGGTGTGLGIGVGTSAGASTSGGTGSVWRVRASSELASSGTGWTELSSNGNGAARAGHSQSGCCTGNSVGCCDFATLGHAYPHGTMMKITGQGGKSAVLPLTDIGNGSSFAPAIGLTPAATAAVGWDGSSEVTIQLASGGSLSVVSGFGTLVSANTGTSTNTPGTHATSPANTPSTHVTHSANIASAGPTATAARVNAGGGTNTSPGSGPSTTTPAAPAAPTLVFPLKAGTYVGSGSWSLDQGVDIATNGGGCGAAAPLLAIAAGTVVGHGISGFGNDAPTLKLDTPISGYSYVYYGHSGPTGAVSVGTHVTAGQIIGSVGCGVVGISTGPHLEIGFATGVGAPAGSGSAPAMKATLLAAKAGQPAPGSGTAATGTAGTAGTTGGGGLGTDQAFQIAKGVVFGTQLEWPTIADTIEAVSLRGHKSLMNDKPLLSFVQQVASATMRSFQSAPNGDFFAFFPDFFGEFNHRDPYWNIHDIEILTGDIQLTDASLCTHMYVVGDTLNYGSSPDPSAQLLEKILSAGTVDIFDFFDLGLAKSNSTTATNGGGGIKTGGYIDPTVATTTTANTTRPWGWGGKRNWRWPGTPSSTTPSTPMATHDSLHTKTGVFAFLSRYGARPVELDQPLIRSSYFEAFIALQQFMLAWSQQWATNFTFTFMPELYPGGRVSFEHHNITMYINSVTHSFDYENGFTTVAELSAPAATKPDSTPEGNAISWGMVNSLRPNSV